MEELSLVFPQRELKDQYFDFLQESSEDIKKNAFGGTIRISDDNSFDSDIKMYENHRHGRELPEGWVPASTYWMIRKSDKKIIGIITIRHFLTQYLSHRGGNIGYYICPSERKKGNATKMLKFALEKCAELHMNKVLITCNKDNTGSVKTIINNGGVFHSEDVDNEVTFQRYWIEIE